MPSNSYTSHTPVEARFRFAVGTLTVVAEQTDQVTASVEPAEAGDQTAQALADSASISFEDDTLTIEVPERGGWVRRSPASLDIRLTLPVGSSVSATTGVLTLSSTGQLDQVAVKAGVGTIDVEQATGVSVKGGDATVTIGSAADVAVKCGRGDVRVATAHDVFVKAGQGQVHLGSSSGDVAVKGAMVSLEIAAARSGEVTFQAAMGSARVGVAEGTTVELDLSSATGDARSELAVAEGSGEAALHVRLRTTSGDVVVERAKAPASAAS